MGVDFDAAGGVGFYVDDHIQKFLEDADFKEAWDYGDYDGALALLVVNELCLYGQCGDCYNGDTSWFIVIDCSNLAETMEKVDKFMEHFNTNYGLDLKLSDINIIVESLLW